MGDHLYQHPYNQMLCGDSEAYYDQQHSLRVMKTQAYIESPDFESHMWGFQGLEQTEETNGVSWELGTAHNLIRGYDWENIWFIAHNEQYDGYILDFYHNVKPAKSLCTMAMVQSLGVQKFAGGASLDLVAKFFGFPVQKGTFLKEMKGRRLNTLSSSEIEKYKAYNVADVQILRQLALTLLPYIPPEELEFHSTINTMFTQPVLSLDRERIETELLAIQTRKTAELEKFCDMFNLVGVARAKTLLGSGKGMADLLELHGAEVPMKQSLTTGKDIYAFAKTDTGFIALQSHENPLVALIANTRASVKSNTEEKRAEALIMLSMLPSKLFCIPHKIGGAHTLRLSGVDGINIQNLPSGRVAGQSKTLRQSIIRAGNGYVSAPDSGQIEARVLSCIADDKEMIGIFARGECPYSVTASDVYGISDTEIKAGDKAYKMGDAEAKRFYMMRQTGKGAVLSLGFGTGAAGLLTALDTVYRVEGITLEECKKIHRIYREKRVAVTNLWDKCKTVLNHLVAGGSGYFGGADGKLFYYTADHDIFGQKTPGIRLPDGMWLTYPHLHKRAGLDQDGTPNGYTEFAYFKDKPKMLRSYHTAIKKYTAKAGKPPSIQKAESIYRAMGYKHGNRLWFGAVVENLCQALAFSILKWQSVQMTKAGLKVCFNVHDEFIVTAMSAVTIWNVAEKAKEIMETSPPWLPEITLECEYGVALNYGDT